MGRILILLVATVLCGCVWACSAQQYEGTCDKPRNANFPFCDSSLSIDARVQDFVSRLTLDEKIGLLVHNTTIVSGQIEMDNYNWWNEALKGVAMAEGTHFRPPTEFATVFPQPINLAASFNKQLFFEIANVTGNEARAFYNVGNSGLTYWSPNINIYRDPRWGRGHETPGEDPHLSAVWGTQFVKGLQGDGTSGFLKTSACCKHFAAHSVEEGRLGFNGIVNDQDMADTYLPAFKQCVQEADASCVMCAYSAINGVPSCADKGLLTDLLRDDWGFDGYIVSDCGAVQHVQISHHYTETPSETCHAVLDAGLDIECASYFRTHLRNAVDDGSVPEAWVNNALTRGYKVLFRMGFFEKDATRPFKELQPPMVDSTPHQALALQAARESIVLLKNAPNLARDGRPVLPIDAAASRAQRASWALIGPHLNTKQLFLANYNGIPSFIKSPLEEIGKYVPDLEWELGCEIASFDNARLQEAEDLARASTQVVLLVGLSANVNMQGTETETLDRANLSLPGLQTELVRRVLAVVEEPVILVVVAGGALDLSEWHNHPKVAAIIWSGYLGQSGGEAIADVIFGVYNPSGRLTQTFYYDNFSSTVEMTDMNMRPRVEDGFPGRTYRFYTGAPLYPFGYGLSYTTFAYRFNELAQIAVRAEIQDDCQLEINLTVQNSGTRLGDHSVLWYVAPPNAGQGGRPLASLTGFERLGNVQPGESREVALCLNRDQFQLADERGEFAVVSGQWVLSVGGLHRIITVL